MKLLVVGTIAFDSVETPIASREKLWAVRQRFFLMQRVILLR